MLCFLVHEALISVKFIKNATNFFQLYKECIFFLPDAEPASPLIAQYQIKGDL